MTVFYVDTSSNYLYTGIYRDKEMLAEKHVNLNHDLSTFAIAEIDKMFKECDVDVKDVDKIRIGMTLAKVYAFMLKKDIITITSLEAMNASNEFKGLKVPIIDARRGYVYAAVYSKDKEVLEASYISLEKLKLVLLATKEKYIYITNDKFKDLDCVSYEPNIKNIIEEFIDRKAINPHLVEPTYFKLTEAEENLNKE